MKHLSDSELQDYLDGNLSYREEDIGRHLDTCASCRARLKQYELLYNGLASDDIPALSTRFAANVLKRIMSEEIVVEESRSPWTFVLSTLGILAALASIIYFVNLRSLLAIFKVGGIADYLNEVLFSRIAELAGGLNIDTPVVFMAILALIIIGALDYIIRNYKHRTSTFLA